MRTLFALARLSRHLPVWLRYSATVLMVGLAVMLRLAAGEPHTAPFVLFFPTIIVVAFAFDRGTAIFATVLSAAAAAFFFFQPLMSFGVVEPQHVIGLAIFVSTGLVTAALTEALHRAYVETAEAQEALSRTAQDRALLLEELSHRMRNDLGTIGSLLSLQAQALDDPTAKSALIAARDRVQVLARVHERLTLRAGVPSIDSRHFITELCDDLRISLVGLRPIQLRISAESHLLDISTTVMLGLIINELLTNALKYAFPEGRSGVISVDFARDDAHLILIVEDNGVGSTGALHGTGMGRRLIRALAASLGGVMAFDEGEAGVGVKAVLRFSITDPVDNARKVSGGVADRSGGGSGRV